MVEQPTQFRLDQPCVGVRYVLLLLARAVGAHRNLDAVSLELRLPRCCGAGWLDGATCRYDRCLRLGCRLQGSRRWLALQVDPAPR